MAKNLVIVESPAKSKTIQQYLGSDFAVTSSIGHIRSIVKKTKDGTPPIDVDNNFETVYEVDSEKKKVVAQLRKDVKTAETVWLATDEDREGEAIAWHLCEVLKLDPEKTNRIVFHEITKEAIQKAIKEPRTVDMSLVRAQQARQILDRIVGFELSPVVWQKVPGGKSAGRVQSPAVRLLVEREREIDDFAGSFQFKVTAIFSVDDSEMKADLANRFDTEEEAQAFLEKLLDATFTISDVTKKPTTRNPSPPFTTSSLQQDANAKLGFGSKATMGSAQKLYQEGKITYMRTDSMSLSGQAIASAANFIKSKFGEEYSQVRNFKTKSAGAQEAHEAIRPTDMGLERATSDEYAQKLYSLIRNRTLASQMAPAKLEKTVITIDISTASEKFEAKGEIVIFDGFLKVYGGGKKDPDILPPVSSGDSLALDNAEAKQLFARPPARYTEGALVKKLEELGIGRPSTYATIISTVLTRGYAEKGESEGEPRDVIVLKTAKTSIDREVIQEKTGSDRGKLVPTPAGKLISDFLTDYFDKIVDYDFTANVEKEFDEIQADKLDRNTMLKNFYGPFHELIEKSGGIDRSKVAQAREVGKHPKSGKPVLARFGRYGPMLQLGATEDKENKPQFAPMPKGTTLEKITMEQALKAFELPRLVGQTKDGQDMNANIGRFGPYIKVDKLFISIKPLDPHEITHEQALDLYDAKLKAEAEKNIADFGDGVKVLKGRFGPYVTDGKVNATIPKKINPKDVTPEQAREMIAEKIKKGPGKRRGGKTTKKATPKKKTTKRKTTAKKKSAIKK
ncbi:type I DNA topoisomerase [Candidatus Saccharibacteria bacterium]|jgi:DNA topoisomerase-1|nr:type I DNA topoisomerase [Candidatus Saccharibacteria bacterium]